MRRPRAIASFESGTHRSYTSAPIPRECHQRALGALAVERVMLAMYGLLPRVTLGAPRGSWGAAPRALVSAANG